MQFPTFFISHGGGPWPWMKDEWRGVYYLDRAPGSAHDWPGHRGNVASSL
jgi:hypothetical protein